MHSTLPMCIAPTHHIGRSVVGAVGSGNRHAIAVLLHIGHNCGGGANGQEMGPCLASPRPTGKPARCSNKVGKESCATAANCRATAQGSPRLTRVEADFQPALGDQGINQCGEAVPQHDIHLRKAWRGARRCSIEMGSTRAGMPAGPGCARCVVQTQARSTRGGSQRRGRGRALTAGMDLASPRRATLSWVMLPFSRLW